MSNVLLRFARCAGAAALVGVIGLGGSAMAASRHPEAGARPRTPPPARACQHLGDRVLWPGMSGHDVRVLQQYLSSRGTRRRSPATSTGRLGHTWSRSSEPTICLDRRRDAAGCQGPAEFAVISSLPHGAARINPDGTATAPAGPRRRSWTMINAANRIIHTSYCYAGGHGSWNSSCYDCSGAVGYVLHAAGMLSSPEPSGSMESQWEAGAGQWVSVYADSGHAFIVIAGRAFDTADYRRPEHPLGRRTALAVDPDREPRGRRRLRRPPPRRAVVRVRAPTRGPTDWR